MCKQVIYSIFEWRCYDEDPEVPWLHRPRASQHALTSEEIAKRLRFGKHMESLGHTANWFYRHVLWTDVCNDVLPLTEKKCALQTKARKGGSGWQSKGCEAKSYNMRGRKEDLKLSGSECMRVFWMPVLARGKLHVEVLGSSFPGDHTSGMGVFVQKLRVAVNTRFQGGGPQPDVVFVDRGGGFYHGTGQITAEFKRALRANAFTAFHGDNAQVQPGRSGDLWLHETAVSWIRVRPTESAPDRCWEETMSCREKYGNRFKGCYDDINGCSPQAHQAVRNSEGSKLK